MDEMSELEKDIRYGVQRNLVPPPDQWLKDTKFLLTRLTEVRQKWNCAACRKTYKHGGCTLHAPFLIEYSGDY